MALQDFVRANGDLYSWKSCRARIDNEDITRKMTAIDFEQSRERKQAYGNDPTSGPVGQTGGKYDPGKPTFTLMRDVATQILGYLADKAGSASYGNATFTLVFQLVEANNDVITTTISECRITKEKDSHKEGTDELTTDFEVTPKRIVKNVNGKDLVLYDDSADGG